MQVNNIQYNNTNTNFQHSINKKMPFFGPVKNTFERQASIAQADYYEAKARLHYMKFLKADEKLETFEKPFSSIEETWRFIKTISSMAYHKYKSWDYSAESHHYRHKFDRKLLAKGK